MQQILLPVDMSYFNKKNINIITNSALAKAGQETFSDVKEIFNILIKTRSHIKHSLKFDYYYGHFYFDLKKFNFDFILAKF